MIFQTPLKLIQYYLDHKSEYDYYSNCLERTIPDGLDVELITFKTLERAWKEATKQYEREHVTPYIYHNPNIFKIASLTNDIDLSKHRWTLDTHEDFEFIKEVYNHFFKKRVEMFYLNDILDFLNNNPHVISINSGQITNVKFKRQVEEDKS